MFGMEVAALTTDESGESGLVLITFEHAEKIEFVIARQVKRG